MGNTNATGTEPCTPSHCGDPPSSGDAAAKFCPKSEIGKAGSSTTYLGAKQIDGYAALRTVSSCFSLPLKNGGRLPLTWNHFPGGSYVIQAVRPEFWQPAGRGGVFSFLPHLVSQGHQYIDHRGVHLMGSMGTLGGVTYYEPYNQVRAKGRFNSLDNTYTVTDDEVKGKIIFGGNGHPLYGRPLQSIDRNGNVLNYTYRPRTGPIAAYQILDTVTGDIGVTLKFGYVDDTSEPAPISSITVTDLEDPTNSRVVTMTHQSNSIREACYLQRITYPDGCSKGYRLTSLDGGHTRLHCEQDQNGYVTYFKYSSDSTGGIVRHVFEPDGQATYYLYSSYQTAVTHIGHGPQRSYYKYDLTTDGTQSMQLRRVRNAIGGTKDFNWDTLKNRPARKIVESGAVTYYVYHPTGPLALVAESSGAAIPQYRRRAYLFHSASDLVRGETGPRFVAGVVPDVTYYVHDAKRNIVSTLAPLGRTSHTVPDIMGRTCKDVRPLGNTTYYNFSALNGTPTSTVDPRGASTLFKHDGFGDLRKQVGPRWTEVSVAAFTTYFAYTKRGLRRKVTDRIGGKTYFDYDSRADRIAEVDPRGVVTQRAFSPMRKVLREWVKHSNAATSALAATYFSYDPYRNLHRVTDLAWAHTYFEYDALARKIAQVDPLGKKTYFGYDAVNHPVRERDALNRVQTSQFDLLGRHISATDRTGAKTYFGYDLGSLLVLRRDPLGRRTTHDHDAAGRRFRTTDALSRQTYFGYDLNDNLVKQRDPAALTTLQSFTPVDQLTTFTNALGQKTYFGYDAAGNQVKVRNARNYSTISAYDRLDRLCAITTPDGKKAYFGYDAVGNRTKVRDQRGNTTLAFHDGLNRRVMSRDALGGEVYHRYDVAGNRTERLDQRRLKTRFGYDRIGRMVKNFDALNNKTYFGYDAVGNRTSVLNPRGFTTSAAYDGENRLRTVTDARAGKTYFGYDAVGNRVAFGDQLNRRTRATYDALDRVQTTVDALNGSTYYGYDSAGDVVKISDAANRRMIRTYDAIHRLVTAADALGQKTYFGYDGAGSLVKVRNGLGNSSVMSYDTVDRLTQVTNPLSQTVKFDYDAAGNRRKEVDGKNQATYFMYDALNRLRAICGQQAQVTYFSYDATSNLTTTNTSFGNRSDVAYDELGRKRRVLDQRLTNLVSQGYGTQAYGTTPYGGQLIPTYQASPSYFTYDAASNLTVTVDSTGTTASTFDELNRETLRAGPKGTVYYGYDSASNRTKVQYPGDLKRATYTFDALNRITQVVSPDAKTAIYQHTPTSRVRKLRFGNNAVCYYTYDNADRVIGIRHATSAGAAILTCDYRRDAAGRITTISRETDLAIYYQYDTADRLTKEIWAKRSTAAQVYAFSYQFDAAGNRTKMRREAATGVITESAYYTYNNANGLRKRWVAPANVATYYTYDRAGSVIRMIEGAGTNTTYYEYGGHGLVTAIIPPVAQGQPWRFGYDGRLNRTKILKGATPTYYCWDGMNQLEERTASGTLIARYTHGRGPVYGVGSVVEVMRKTATSTYFQYLHMDHQGSVNAVSDINQSITHKYTIDSFGREIVGTSGSISLIENNSCFHGNWISCRSLSKVLILSPTRLYSADTGTFLQQDLLFKLILPVSAGKLSRLSHFGGSSFLSETWKRSRAEDVPSQLISTVPIIEFLSRACLASLYSGSFVPNQFDPTGLWTPAGHDYLLDQALGDLSPENLDAMKEASAHEDRLTGGQSAENAYRHGMRSPSQSAEEAIKLTDSFIEHQATKAAELYCQGKHKEAYSQLGSGAHAITDSDSPMHRDASGQPNVWEGQAKTLATIGALIAQRQAPTPMLDLGAHTGGESLKLLLSNEMKDRRERMVKNLKQYHDKMMAKVKQNCPCPEKPLDPREPEKPLDPREAAARGFGKAVVSSQNFNLGLMGIGR